MDQTEKDSYSPEYGVLTKSNTFRLNREYSEEVPK